MSAPRQSRCDNPRGKNDRERIALALPAILLSYMVLLWPLVYERAGVTADLANASAPAEQHFLLTRLFIPALAGVAGMILVAERRRLGRFHLAGFFLVIGFFGYLGLTALWALAPSTSLAKLMLIDLQIVALLPAVLLARQVEDVMAPLFWVMAATLAINAAAIAILPPTPIGHAGVYAHKNTLGASAAMGGFFALYGLTRKTRAMRVAGALMLPAASLLLVASQSKTSLGLFLLAPLSALAFLGARRWLRLSFPLVLVVVAIAGAFALSGEVGGFSPADVSNAVSGDSGFTGRADIWKFAVSAISERPLIGYGYQSFWGAGAGSPAAGLSEGFLQRTPHAHNGYLDLALQGGLIALALFLPLLLMVARWIDRVIDADAGLGFLAATLLLYNLLQNLLETDWLQGLSGSGVLLFLLILLSAVKPRGSAPA